MLVLTRRLGESIILNDDIKITVVDVKGQQVRMGIDAPKEVEVHREEIFHQINNPDQPVKAKKPPVKDRPQRGANRAQGQRQNQGQGQQRQGQQRQGQGQQRQGQGQQRQNQGGYREQSSYQSQSHNPMPEVAFAVRHDDEDSQKSKKKTMIKVKKSRSVPEEK